MSKNIHLVVIDPQNSFCKVVPQDQQQILHDGELCVAGAWEDMNRVANMVNRIGKKFADIHVTLDSHHSLHVAHPVWYRDANGNRPDPFTIMRAENGKIIGSKFDASGQQHDIGEFSCFKPSATKRTLEYLQSLQSASRYPHCIWPTHCLIGTAGHNVVPQLMDALQKWTNDQGDAIIDFVTKGSNPYVEHFSAVQAEVVDPSDPSTQLNVGFIQTLEEADEILFAGEAGSHCLANTVRDIANSFNDADDKFLKKCVLLTDGTSPVPGFESYQEAFIKEMTQRGMKTTTTVDYLK
jgi:nicotinamidase-related amidase